MNNPVSKAVEMETRFTRLTGARFPVMQEGLGPYKTVHLAAAVANAGGLGTVSIPGITEEPAAGSKLLRAYIEEACALTDGKLAVNVPVGADKVTGQVLPFSAAYVSAVVEAVRDPNIAKRLRVITTSAGAPGPARRLIENSGLLHFHKVGGTKQAVRAEQDGVDAVIASGYEAGGHTHSRPVHTFILVPSVVEAVSIPVEREMADRSQLHWRWEPMPWPSGHALSRAMTIPIGIRPMPSGSLMRRKATTWSSQRSTARHAR
jgi:enoyl-[acyl-carrier protein] reductase II